MSGQGSKVAAGPGQLGKARGGRTRTRGAPPENQRARPPLASPQRPLRHHAALAKHLIFDIC